MNATARDASSVNDLRFELAQETDPRQDIVLTTIHGDKVHLTDWSFNPWTVEGTLASSLQTTLNGAEAVLSPGFKLAFAHESIDSVVNL